MNKITSSLTAKIIITLLIACVTLLVSRRIAEYSFQRIMGPIKQLSEQNVQLRLVNSLFKDIVQLDHDQRVFTGSETSINYISYINSSRHVLNKLDTLELLSGGNKEQAERVNKMKSILNERNRLFVQYLNLRKEFQRNDSLGIQIRELSDFANYLSLRGDSSMYNVESDISHTVVEEEIPAEEQEPVKRGLLNRLFGRKPDPPPPTKEINHYIYEKSNTLVDTEILKREDSIINRFSNTLAGIEQTRKKQLSNINDKRIRFEQANSRLVNELLSILNEMEQSELSKNKSNNLLAASIINDSLVTTNKVLITFIVLTVVFGVLIFLDIGRSNRYRKQLIRAKEEADVLGSIKQQFLANMSHELRTPLQSIVGYSELMLSDRTQQNDHNLQIVNQSSLHLLNIVNQILDYSSISADTFSIEHKVFNIKSVLQDVYNVVHIQAKEKQLDFYTNIDQVKEETVKGDPFRLKQILLNLLNNAIKFTNSGSVDFTVMQESGKHASTYSFIVKDTGIGIDPENLDKIFNDFEQVSTSQLHNGNGLGLSIVKKIVEKHNGSITVDSAPGSGSAFTVKILYQHATAVIQGHPSRHMSGIENITDGAVWVIDDDIFILELCSKILNRHHINHHTFLSYTDIMEAPVPVNLKAVFMDIRMPDISGYELVQLLKKKSSMPQDVRFIALTAQVFPEETEIILSKGFDHILHKPFLEADLLSVLHIEAGNSGEDTDEQLTTLFKTETTKDLDQVQHLLQDEEYVEIASLFHKMASRLGQMGYGILGKKARRVEINIKRGNYRKELIEEVCRDIQHIL